MENIVEITCTDTNIDDNTLCSVECSVEASDDYVLPLLIMILHINRLN